MLTMVTLFLCGDVMLGRGIDQVMPHSVAPTLHEPYVKDARRYVEIAERAGAAIPQPIEPGYVWGDGRAALAAADPDVVYGFDYLSDAPGGSLADAYITLASTNNGGGQ